MPVRKGKQVITSYLIKNSNLNNLSLNFVRRKKEVHNLESVVKFYLLHLKATFVFGFINFSLKS